MFSFSETAKLSSRLAVPVQVMCRNLTSFAFLYLPCLWYNCLKYFLYIYWNNIRICYNFASTSKHNLENAREGNAFIFIHMLNAFCSWFFPNLTWFLLLSFCFMNFYSHSFRVGLPAMCFLGFLSSRNLKKKKNLWCSWFTMLC